MLLQILWFWRPKKGPGYARSSSQWAFDTDPFAGINPSTVKKNIGTGVVAAALGPEAFTTSAEVGQRWIWSNWKRRTARSYGTLGMARCAPVEHVGVHRDGEGSQKGVGLHFYVWR